MSMLSKMIAPQPDVHIAVRETYRRAMLRKKTQHEAFDLALAVVLRRLSLVPGTERRAVAVMLANEPDRLGRSPLESARNEAVRRSVGGRGHRTTGSVR